VGTGKNVWEERANDQRRNLVERSVYILIVIYIFLIPKNCDLYSEELRFIFSLFQSPVAFCVFQKLDIHLGVSKMSESRRMNDMKVSVNH
jgi:hypothetical protein